MYVLKFEIGKLHSSKKKNLVGVTFPPVWLRIKIITQEKSSGN